MNLKNFYTQIYFYIKFHPDIGRIFMVLFTIILCNTPVVFCVDNLSIYEKYQMILTITKFEHPEIYYNLVVHSYMKGIKSIVISDLDHLHTESEVKEYAKFIAHMCRYTVDIYDEIGCNPNLSPAEKLKLCKQQLGIIHLKQWNNWYGSNSWFSYYQNYRS